MPARLNVRDFLTASGVSPRDISDAVRQSRQVTRRIADGAHLLSRMLAHVGDRAKGGTKRQAAARRAAEALQKIGEGADKMLATGPTKQRASARTVRRK